MVLGFFAQAMAAQGSRDAIQANAEGNREYYRGDFAGAHSKFEKALRIASEQRDDQYRAIAMYGLARASAQLCNLADADKWFLASIELRERLPDEKHAMVTQNYLEYSRFLAAHGRTAQALAYMDKAVPNLEKLGVESADPIAYADFLDAYASILREANRPEDSERARSRGGDLRARHAGRKAGFKPEIYPTSCAAAPMKIESGGTPIDQVPMYGGMDRTSIPELRAGDEKLIQDTTKAYGSRAAASTAFANNAFTYYKQDKLDLAMRRFNQAWLLNPDNPEPYWGFASILHDQGKYCEGVKLLELGASKGPLQKAHIPDLAVLYAACARHGQGLQPQERLDLLRKSTETFQKGEGDPEVAKPYLYFQWTRAHHALGEYTAAWEKVREYRKHTSEPFDPRLIKTLSEKLPEPK